MNVIFLLLALSLAAPPQEYPLVIVHIESQWSGAARVAQEAAMLAADRENIIMLVTDDNDQWMSDSEVPEVRPSEVIAAPGGFWGGIDDDTVEFCGGYFRGCLANAVKVTVQRNPNVTVVLPMKAVYHGSKRTLYEYQMSNYKGDQDGFVRYIESLAGEFGFTNMHLTIDGDKLVLEEKSL